MVRRFLLLLLALAWLQAGTVQGARIVAVGDVHGEIDGFDSVLRAAALIDEDGRWVGGDAVLVQTGDVTDRGTRVRAVMDRLRSLQEQAPAQGGRVVPLLGNHEISNLIHLFDETSTPAAVYHQIWRAFSAADSTRRQRAAYKQWHAWLRRYPGCVKQEDRDWRENRRAWMADHPPGFVEYIEALSPVGEYGKWLRGLDIAVEIDGSIFLHGGLSPQLVEQGHDSVAEINRTVERAIEQFDQDRQRLIDEELIVPFSSLWELHCALFVEIAALGEDGSPEALARRVELDEMRSRLPGMGGWFPTEAHGPLWYRGLAMAEEADLSSQLDLILEAFGAERIAVGHTPQPGEIRSRFDGRVFLIDTAMAYAELGGRAAALEIDGDRVTAVYADERVLLVGAPEAAPPEKPQPKPAEGTNGHGDESIESSNGHADQPAESTNGDQETEAVPPAADTADTAESSTSATGPAREVWLGPDGEPLPFSDVSEVLDFLANAKVVDSSAIGSGVTLPKKLLLERDGVRAHAIFHDVNVEKRRERLRGGRVIAFFRDTYENNVAAFELSRILGLTNVPPAVVRKVGREEGSVQLWIEDSNTEADRRRLDINPDGDWRLTSSDMQVFDNLSNNIDRNQGNILYDADWNLWFIDHTRTFGRTKALPSPERVKRCSRSLYRALQELDEAEVRRRLRPYIGVYEIGGLMARRDLLVALIEERIAATSEMAVLFDYGDPAAAATEGKEDPPAIPEAPAEPPF
jgi:hypothetical protein